MNARKRGFAAQKHSALRELEPLASALLPILLALVLARVAREKSQLFQFRAQLGVELQKSPRDSQFRGSGLARGPSARRGNHNVEFVRRFGGEQRLPYDRARRLARKIVFKGPAVYGDLPFPRPQENS